MGFDMSVGMGVGRAVDVDAGILVTVGVDAGGLVTVAEGCSDGTSSIVGSIGWVWELEVQEASVTVRDTIHISLQ